MADTQTRHLQTVQAIPVETLLPLPDDCLAVFVDDTGHEALLKDHPVYGLGGCATPGRDLDRYIRDPWREVRRLVTGSPDTPLHANEFARSATQDDILNVAKFFRVNPFARLGGIVSFKSQLSDHLDSIRTIADVLKERIRQTASHTPCGSVAIIFESSDRADRLIEAAFQDFGLEEDGKPIPVECYFMRKELGEPSLEVADFIMHAVGRQARRNLTERGVFVPDFQCVFHSLAPTLTSFMEIDSVTPVARDQAG